MIGRRYTALVLVVMLSGCGWTPADEQILTKFFERSRIYDRTRLAEVATVVFDPKVDGVVDQFEVVNRGPEERAGTERVTKQLTVQAAVRSPAGRTAPRTLSVTLEWRDDAWLVTRVK
jgi:hypothetical protein